MSAEIISLTPAKTDPLLPHIEELKTELVRDDPHGIVVLSGRDIALVELALFALRAAMTSQDTTIANKLRLERKRLGI